MPCSLNPSRPITPRSDVSSVSVRLQRGAWRQSSRVWPGCGSRPVWYQHFGQRWNSPTQRQRQRSSRQQVSYLRRRHGPREVIPLAELTAECGQGSGLVRCLDAFSDRAEPQGAPQLDDPCTRAASGGPIHISDEGPVDLHLVDRQAAKVAQRRVAGPKVVDRDLDSAHRSERTQPLNQELWP